MENKDIQREDGTELKEFEQKLQQRLLELKENKAMIERRYRLLMYRMYENYTESKNSKKAA